MYCTPPQSPSNHLPGSSFEHVVLFTSRVENNVDSGERLISSPVQIEDYILWPSVHSLSQIPCLEVIKLELISKLKIKRNDCLLADMCLF